MDALRCGAIAPHAHEALHTHLGQAVVPAAPSIHPSSYGELHGAEPDTRGVGVCDGLHLPPSVRRDGAHDLSLHLIVHLASVVAIRKLGPGGKTRRDEGYILRFRCEVAQ